MKKNLSGLLFSFLLIAGIGIVVTSCGKDDYLTENEVKRIVDKAIQDANFQPTNWKIKNVVSPSDAWDWKSLPNGTGGYWFTSIVLDELTDYIFKEGAIVTYFVFSDINKTPLPYLRTYSENGKKYTEYYTCEIIKNSDGKYEAVFIVETSDLGKKPSKDAAFQVVMLW